MFKTDQPVESSTQDLLGRASFSQSFGKALLSHKDKTSIVTALYGKWGSGKSSVINMALEYIEEETKDLPKAERPIVFKFNPWNFSDQNQLVFQFFKQLAFILKHKDYGENAKKAGEKLEVYSNLVAPLVLVPNPLVSGGALAVMGVLKGVGKAALSWGKSKEKDLSNAKDDLNRLLSNEKRKIIIVIDDIDRLTNSEIRQVFQLVKMLGDFSNTIYLLAFDHDLVIKALAEVQEGAGQDYLEKIIQVPFELPQIEKSEVEKLLFSQLDELIADIPEDKWDPVYWGNVYQSGLKYFFLNLRDVTRYLNSLRFSFEMTRGHVNPIDFLAITSLQVFLPQVYSGIRDNKDLFAGYFDDQRSDAVLKQATLRIEEVLGRTDLLSIDELKEFLTYLFPKLETIFNNMGYGADWLGNWRRDGRVCSPDNFEIFFKLALPPGVMSNVEMEAILGLADDRDSFSEALSGLNKDGRIIKFLERFEDYTREHIPKENIPNILCVLMDIGDTFPEGESGFLGYDTPMRLLRISYQLSQRFETHDERFELFVDAIDSAQKSLYTIVHEVAVQGQQHGRRTTKEHPDPAEKRTVNEDQLLILEEKASQRIQEWAESGRLANHNQLQGILFSWKHWDGQDGASVKKFVEDLIKGDEGLIDFVASFVGKSHSHTMGDRVSKIHWKINLDSVKHFVSPKTIEPRIRVIRDSSEFEVLSEAQRNAIQVFLDTFDGKVEDW